MSRRLRVPISSARRRLFELAELVRAGDDSVVVLEQRKQSEGVALVREARLAYLEARVMQMDKQESATFTLAGSLAAKTSEAAVEQALHDIRRAWDAPRTLSGPVSTGRAGTRRRK